MKKKIFDFIYILLLVIGIFSGIYGIGYESSILKWIGAILVFGIPIITFLIEYILKSSY